MKGEDFSADRMANEYLDYLFREKADARHVRRVASWLGLLVLGIESIKDRWWVSYKRQLCFEVGKKRYKVKFNHKVGRGSGRRGGIEFVEVGTSQGQPELETVRTILDLDDAAKFFRRPRL